MVKNRRIKLKLFHPLVLASIFVAALLYGKIIPVKNTGKYRSVLSLKNLSEITGCVVSNPVKTSKGKYYRLKIKLSDAKDNNGAAGSAEGIIQVLVPSEQIEAHFPGKLYTAIKDNRYVLCEQGSFIRAKGKSTAEDLFVAGNVENLNPRHKKIVQLFFKTRAVLRIQFRRLMYAWGAAGGLLLALLSGIREYTENSVGENFKNAGLSHVLALSGMHLNLFSGIAGKTAGELISAKKTMLFQFIAVVLFVYFAGFTPSLFRAFLCTIISFTAVILKLKDFSMLHVLSTSFLLHVSLKPEDIFEAAFILSYSALAGILLMSEFFKFLLIIKTPEKLTDSISASTGAQFFTAPISLKMMGTFAPVGIISTVVISPLITIFIYSGLLLIIICLIFPFFVPAADFFLKIIYNSIAFIVMIFAKFPLYSART